MSINWNLDPAHSELGFKVRHLMITNVSGSFGKFNATVSSNDESFSDAKVSFTAELDSISTGDAQRDGHLKSPDFFDAANHPHMSFESTNFDGKQLQGNLTIKGVSHPVSLDVEFGGVGKDPWGNTKAGFSISGKINRKDWGLNWNAPLEAGGVLVSEEVKIHGEIQLVKA